MHEETKEAVQKYTAAAEEATTRTQQLEVALQAQERLAAFVETQQALKQSGEASARLADSLRSSLEKHSDKMRYSLSYISEFVRAVLMLRLQTHRKCENLKRDQFSRSSAVAKTRKRDE